MIRRLKEWNRQRSTTAYNLCISHGVRIKRYDRRSASVLFDEIVFSCQSHNSTSSEPQTLIDGWGEFYDGMTDLIVKSGVKEALADHPVSVDLHEALNDEVAELLTDAVEPRDL